MYSRVEKSGKQKTEGRTSSPDWVEATFGVALQMAKLARDEYMKMGQEALDRVETQWAKSSLFQQ